MPGKYTPKLTLLLLSVITILNVAVAQQPKPIAKFKPPVVQTFLGSDSGNGTLIPVSEGKQIIGLPLKVIDSKNNSYPVVSYQFSYNRVGIKEDEQTGQTTPEKDMVANRFSATPLTDIWIKTIQDELHSGEEFYFFDIIVKDKDGRLFFAPELKLIMQ